MKTSKPISKLTIEDCIDFPIWEFTNQDDVDDDETWVMPVRKLPVTSLSNRLVVTKVCLNNGDKIWCVLSNVTLNSLVHTKHFITIWVFYQNNWFELARYHDVDYGRRGPDALASFMGLSVDEVFPISYNISNLAVGIPDVVRGIIPVDVPGKLSDSELIDMAVRG